MKVEEEIDGTRLVIDGPVRLGEVAELLEHARAANARRLDVELDLGEAEHMHTAAWQVLWALAKQTRENGCVFRVQRVSPNASTMLEFLDPRAWLSGEAG